MDTTRSPNPTTTLRRLNSTATSVLIPSKLSLSTNTAATDTAAAAATSSSSSSTSRTTSSSSSSSSQSFSTVEFDITPIPNAASYTSLKDLLPSSSAAAAQSPTSSGGGGSGYEISIRNRLVKQAAWAYLRPMSTSPESGGRSFLHGLWVRFSGNFFNAIRVITQAFDGFLRAIRVRSSR